MLDFLTIIETKIYTVDDISKMLLVHEETVRKWIRENKLCGIELGSRKEGYIILDFDFNIFMDEYPKYRYRYELIKDKINVRSRSIEDIILDYLYNKITYDKYIIIYSKGLHGRWWKVTDLLMFIKNFVPDTCYNVIEKIVYDGFRRMPTSYVKGHSRDAITKKRD